MTITNKQAVIFDMDGLLINSEPLWYEAEVAVFAELGVSIDAVPVAARTGLRIDNIVELYFRASPWQGVTKQEVYQRIMDYATQRIRETRPIMPGVKEALHKVKAQGLKTAIASASPLNLVEEVVALFKLEDDFDTLCSSEHLSNSKPHPEVYLMTAKQLGVSPLDCIGVEDSVNGMIAVKAARMKSIVVPEASVFSDPRWSLAEIKLKSLLDLSIDDLR